ncbi:hypothetical protein JZ751_005354, partial [Albula glossodonta]
RSLESCLSCPENESVGVALVLALAAALANQEAERALSVVFFVTYGPIRSISARKRLLLPTPCLCAVTSRQSRAADAGLGFHFHCEFRGNNNMEPEIEDKTLELMCSVPRSLWLGCSLVAESLCALPSLQGLH